MSVCMQIRSMFTYMCICVQYGRNTTQSVCSSVLCTHCGNSIQWNLSSEAEEVLQEGGALGTERILMMHVYVDIDTKVKLQ